MAKSKKEKARTKQKTLLGKIWYFIWEDNSVWSWIANIILAFVLIKFIVYPAIGFGLHTTHPVVAVVSGSMEHKLVHPCIMVDMTQMCVQTNNDIYEICGKTTTKKQSIDFTKFWSLCGPWYEKNTDIDREEFSKYPYKNGFNVGDIMVLYGTQPQKIKRGDIIVYWGKRSTPIIHRVVRVQEVNGVYYYQTKGDHNYDADQAIDAQSENITVSQNELIGKAVLKIPFLGYIKIGFVKLVLIIKTLFVGG